MINVDKIKIAMQEVVCEYMPDLCDLVSSQAWCLGGIDRLQLLATNLDSLLSQFTQDELLDIADKLIDLKHGDLAQILIFLISNVSSLDDLMSGSQLSQPIQDKRDEIKAKIVQQMIFKESIVKYGSQSLLIELKNYLEAQPSLSPEDQAILDQINAKLP